MSISQKHQWFGGVWAVLWVASLAGCGGVADRPKLHRVTGVVTLDGNPVEGANVNFSTAKSPRVASGVTDADGNYLLTTFNTDDGALEGEHAVTITKTDATTSESGELMDPGAYMKAMQGSKGGKLPKSMLAKALLPTKYADGKTSGLKRTVVAGEKNPFDFALTTDGAAPAKK